MKPIKKFRFIFKLPDHKQFEYQPLYYDPEKEKAKTRDLVKTDEVAAMKNRISAAFRRESKSRFDKNLLWRRLIIFAIMLALAYRFVS
jgi:predicted RNA-binding protein with PUA-like domain